MKKSLLVTALALVLALAALIGLALSLDRTATPLNIVVTHPWGDSAAAQGLAVHTAAVYGDMLYWDTDFSVAEGEDTRFSFRPQASAGRPTGEVSDVKDEWYLTRLCVTEHGKFVTENLLQDLMPQQDDWRTVRVRDDFVAYRMYLTPMGGGGGDGTLDTFWGESQDDWVPFDKLRIPVGDRDQLTERAYSLDIRTYGFEYILQQTETRFHPFSIGGDGHVLVTVGFAPDAPVESSWAPEGFGLWDVPVMDTRVNFDGGWYASRRPDVGGAKLVFPLDIENQRVVALTETADGDVLLVTAENGQFVLRILDAGTCALRQELVLGAAEELIWEKENGSIAYFGPVLIFPEEDYILVTLNDRELLVLEKAEAGYRIGLHSEIMELRSRRDAAGTYEWTWQRTGTPDETGDDYAGDAYHVIRNGLRALCYRDGKLALASRDPSGLQDIILEVYGDGGMLYGALLENGLESQAYTQSYYLTTPWQGDPLTLTWGEE